jgi:hypothetical protein
MEANGLETRRVKNSLRNDDRDEGHDREVGVERANLLELAFAAQGGRLAQRQSEFERFGLERIGSPGSVRRGKHVHNLLTVRMKLIKGFLGEGCLA